MTAEITILAPLPLRRGLHPTLQPRGARQIQDAHEDYARSNGTDTKVSLEILTFWSTMVWQTYWEFLFTCSGFVRPPGGAP